MFSFYSKSLLDDGNVLLKNEQITISDYDINILPNGDILIKKKVDVVDILTNENNISLKHSQILSCRIQGTEVTEGLKYNTILRKVYEHINDGAKIIRTTQLNIQTGKIIGKGFHYIDTLGVSVQNVDADKACIEIFNQAKGNGIEIAMKAKLADNSIITISSP